MKFWKHLCVLIEIVKELIPDWRDKFVSYKDLKKQLNKIYPKEDDETNNDDFNTRPNKRPRLNDHNENEMEAGGGGEEVVVVVEKEVIDFKKLLEEEIEKFNAFFLDKQENYVIKLKVLRERVAETENSSKELMKVGREVVDFHGEMVLLENYSALNYLGLVKILKKYDKRSGALIRLPFIQKVLQQPFFRTDILNKLVKECEAMILFSLATIAALSEASEDNEDPDNNNGGTEGEERLHRVPEEPAESENTENMYVRLTSLALQVLKKIRSESSTVNEFSLPPM